MPPTSDGEIRTVGASLERLIPDADHLSKIRTAIAATHKATILASELLNMHLRKILAADVCKHPASPLTAPESYYEWIRTERSRLGIDAAVGEWEDKPLLYHLKARPHRFLRCMLCLDCD
jgi:hypothetical protein